MELGIDTSTRYASVALSIEGSVEIELTWRSQQNHSVELVPALRRVMEQVGTDVGSLGAIYVAKGPGGFSSLRVGISFSKSLAAARSARLVAVGTLDVEAEPYRGLGRPVCALIDAGRDILYTATFGVEDQSKAAAEYRAVSHDELLDSAPADTLYCGEGLGKLSAGLRERLGEDALLSNAMAPTRQPAALAQIGYRMLSASQTVSPEELQPLYIRGSQFEVAQRTWGQS
jgi:tRNA threonylcarbamoyl adenosine modification protein YeaZ